MPEAGAYVQSDSQNVQTTIPKIKGPRDRKCMRASAKIPFQSKGPNLFDLEEQSVASASVPEMLEIWGATSLIKVADGRSPGFAGTSNLQCNKIGTAATYGKNSNWFRGMRTPDDGAIAASDGLVCGLPLQFAFGRWTLLQDNLAWAPQNEAERIHTTAGLIPARFLGGPYPMSVLPPVLAGTSSHSTCFPSHLLLPPSSLL